MFDFLEKIADDFADVKNFIQAFFQIVNDFIGRIPDPFGAILKLFIPLILIIIVAKVIGGMRS